MIEAIKTFKPKVVAIVHAETSTGVHQPVDRLVLRPTRPARCWSSIASPASPGCPSRSTAGRSTRPTAGRRSACPARRACRRSRSRRAVEKLAARKSKVQSWYLDLNMVRQYWGQERFYHHTAPINMLYGLHEALTIVLEEGLDNRFTRHRAMHDRLRTGLKELGIDYVSQEGHHLPMLNAVKIPAGVDDAKARRRLLNDYGIEIGGGLGDFKGKAWRIGLMGSSSSIRNVDLVLTALRAIVGQE